MATITTVSTLPLANNELPWYDFTAALDGQRYLIGIRYNSRMDRWFMDISDAQQNPIIMGVILLIGRILTEQYRVRGTPPGYFFVADNTGNNTQPGMQSFLKTHSLLYAGVT